MDYILFVAEAVLIINIAILIFIIMKGKEDIEFFHSKTYSIVTWIAYTGAGINVIFQLIACILNNNLFQ